MLQRLPNLSVAYTTLYTNKNIKILSYFCISNADEMEDLEYALPMLHEQKYNLKSNAVLSGLQIPP